MSLEKAGTIMSPIVGLATLVFGVIGLFFVNGQLKQTNVHKSWDNYNTMNSVYREMYNTLQTKEFARLRATCLNYDNLEHQELAWIRSYYNLYAEEFDLASAELLPDHMMEETINPGFRYNLKQYPSIAQGFDSLLKEGAFKQGVNFTEHVKLEISKVEKLNKCSATVVHEKLILQQIK